MAFREERILLEADTAMFAVLDKTQLYQHKLSFVVDGHGYPLVSPPLFLLAALRRKFLWIVICVAKHSDNLLIVRSVHTIVHRSYITVFSCVVYEASSNHSQLIHLMYSIIERSSVQFQEYGSCGVAEKSIQL